MAPGRKAVSVVLIALMLLPTGCGKEGNLNLILPSQERTSDTGTTSSAGTTRLDLGPYEVSVTTQSETGQPVAGIAVSGYLLKNGLLLVGSDPNGAYYPCIRVIPSASIQPTPPIGGPSSVRSASPEEVEAIPVAAILIVVGVALAVYEFTTDPPHFETIRTDEWTTEHCAEGDINDLFTLLGLVGLAGSAIIHVSNAVLQTTGASVRTAGFVLSRISDVATFASLVGLVFRIFDQDMLRFCYVTYSDGRLPIVYIDTVTLNRDFWCQFTLTWGKTPRDLDSHLWTPSISGNTFHVYWDELGSPTSSPYAELDVDDVQSYGPEHMTIYRSSTGTYTYAVHHYNDWPDDAGVISQSGAIVRVFKPNGDTEVIRVPTTSSQPGYWWHVCEVDGSTGVVRTINSISASPPVSSPPDDGMPKR